MPTPTAPPAYAPTPPAAQPVMHQQPAAAEPVVQYVYVKQPGLPGWLVTLGVFVGLTAAGYAFYSLVLNKQRDSASGSSAASAPASEEAAATKAPRGRRDMSKYLEVAGIRIVEENKKPAIRLMLVNHSNVEMASLAGTILLTTEGKSELSAIPFSLASLGPYEAKDISAPLKTKLRAYELPDWQFIKAQVRLNAGSE